MSRMLLNGRRSPARVPEPAGLEVERFHRLLPGYAPTPLHSLAALAAELGVGHVSVKVESDRFGLPAFKILGASWALERAIRERKTIRSVVAASAGNHGRAVARCAAGRGLHCQIYLPSDCSAERASLIAGEGAEVVRVEGDYDAAAEAAWIRAQQPDTVLLADVSHDADAIVPAWITDGYTTLFREIERQATEPIDVLVVPMGVGSLAAAAVRWAVHGGGTRVIGVEPVTAACITESLRRGVPTTVATPGTDMAGLNCPTPSAVAWPTIRDGLDGTVIVNDAEAHDEMRRLSALGLQIGDCGAAPLAALRILARAPRTDELHDVIGVDAHIVCIATEGASDPTAYQAIIGETA